MSNIVRKRAVSILLLDLGIFIKSLYLLMKPRVMSLVIFTCTVGLLTSPNQISLFDSLISILFVAIGAGAAGTLNMWYEADLDSLMTRTCLRPIPTGKIKKNQALYFGIVLSILSIHLGFLPFLKRGIGHRTGHRLLHRQTP